MNPRETNALSVSQLSQILKSCFENPMFQDIAVFGEVYSIRLGKFSYIELGDQGHKETNSPLLKCAFSTYYGQDYNLPEVKVGDVILVRGSLSYYPHGSSITLWGKEEVQILQSQAGKNLLAKKKTLEKLDKLGYLDETRKRKLPKYCKKVAILTARSGAAYQDILKTLHDRFPVSTVLYPIVVQGETAASSIVKAMREASQGDYDCILLGRGGGSKTDLSCFDDEKVALAIAESPIPVITCIGHQIDTAIADRVSDLHAITPTEGASLINPSLEEVREERAEFDSSLRDSFLNLLRSYEMGLESLIRQLEALSPKSRVLLSSKAWKDKSGQMDSLFLARLSKEKERQSNFHHNLDTLFRQRLSLAKERKNHFDEMLSVADPEKWKEKGFALLYKDGKLVSSASELQKGDEVTITYSDGRREAKII